MQYPKINIDAVPSSIKEYFTAAEFTVMSDYEKHHLSRVHAIYEALHSAGLPVRPPEFMLRKKSRKEKMELLYPCCQDSLEGSDQEWTPALERQKKPRGWKVSSSCQCTSGHEEEKKLMLPSKRKKRRKLTESNKEEDEVHVYPLRKRRVTSYMSLATHDNEDFFYCEDCDLAYEGDCPEHGALICVDDTEIESINLKLSVIQKKQRETKEFVKDRVCTKYCENWCKEQQMISVKLSPMCHYHNGQINAFLKPMLQRDFISALPAKGLDHIAEKILAYLDAKSLCAAELVCKEWYRVILEGSLWKKLIECKVRTDTLWKGLSERQSWNRYLFKQRHRKSSKDQSFYRMLYPQIVHDIKRIENNWRTGRHHLQKIYCPPETSKGVYCLQYDDHKIITGVNHTIKIWNRSTLECIQVLTGHTSLVVCLQYDENIIISGSLDSTVRVWDVHSGKMINTLIYHREAVLDLRFCDGILVTGSEDRSIAIWNIQSPTEINLSRVLVGRRAAVNAVDFDKKYIVSGLDDNTIKVWKTLTCEFVRTLNGHKNAIVCLQYRERLIVSGSLDNTIRLWDIEFGACLRVLEGHEKLVTCVRFDSKRIVSGAFDGKIKVWDLQAALDPRAPVATLCLRTLVEHSGRVFHLQFDEFQILSSSYDDSILIWDFLNVPVPDGQR